MSIFKASLFTFPSRYLFTIGHCRVLRLRGWSPKIQARFHVSRSTHELRISITFTGLSPSVVSFSKLFKLSKLSCWPIPFSLATTYGVSIDFFSSGYLDVSVLQVVSLNLCIQFKVPHKVVGFPIRKFSDQNLHTAPRNFSQYITSFIVFQCQGIRQTPLNA